MVYTKLFKDIIILQRGYNPPTQKRVGGLYPLVSSSKIDGKINVYKVTGPGVVTGRSGTIGEVQYIEDNYWPLNTTLYVTDFKNNVPKYIYYWLSNFPLSAYATGTSVPTLDRNDLFNLQCKINDVQKQHHIVDNITKGEEIYEN